MILTTVSDIDNEGFSNLTDASLQKIYRFPSLKY